MSSPVDPPPDPTDDFQRRLDAAFQEALDLPEADRGAFLSALRRRDPRLHEELTRLLALDRDAERFMEDSGRIVSEAVADGLGEAGWVDGEGVEGREVGRYRLIREIGRGGAGTVYLAERADGSFEQRVAVKVLRRGLDTEDTVRRFLAERRILASLQHENIAAVYDGGATDDGRPYFVMEHVRGRPITEYADRAGLSVDERLRLVMEVGRAVQHAHRRLVIHRDLKPSNILVTDEGVVKLLDFGIAKLLDPSQDPESSVRTRTGVLLLTPEYGSPEQVSGAAVTTATDVYQLGAVLYTLLTGCRPYRAEDASTQALRRAILEQEPRRPSDVVLEPPPDQGIPAGASSPGAGPGKGPAGVATRSPSQAIARARGTDPRGLSRKLAGDLDTIILKALRKEPERRYGSVERLVDDLDRHLEGHPVSARPDTFWYRGRKLLSRRPWILPTSAAAALVALLLGGGLVLHSERMQAERDRAMVEARKAEEVTDFLIGMFESANPGDERRDTLTVRALLQDGAQEVQDRLTEEPEVRASLMHALGRVHLNLGLPEDAQVLLEQARALRLDLGGEEHPEMARTLLDLGRVHFRERRFDRAEGLYREALSREGAKDAPDTVILARAMEQLGATLRETGDPDSAATLVRRALALRSSHEGRDTPAFASTQATLAFILRGQGELDEAEELYRQVLEFQENSPEVSPLSVAATKNNLAFLLREQGQSEEAARLYRDALEIHMSLLGAGHRTTELTMSNLATALYYMGDVEGTEALLRERVDVAKAELPSTHWRIGGALGGVARFLADEGRIEEAAELRRESLEVYRAGLGPAHDWTLRAQGELGANLMTQGRLEEAEAVLLDAYRLAEEAEESEAMEAALRELAHHLAALYEAWDRPEEAERFLPHLP